MKSLSFPNDYLKRFRVLPDQTLFAPTWSALKEHKCPLCGHKLKFPFKSKMAMCNSKKHGKAFLISKDKLPPHKLKDK